MIRILLADDHELVRKGLRVLLESTPGLNVVGEASDGLEAVELAERYRPDIVIMDIMMPGLSGLDATLQVRQRVPDARVVLLSMHSNDSYILQALKNGVSGYVLKDTVASSIVEAVNSVIAGKRYLSATLSDRIVNAYALQAQSSPPDVYDTLTAREREVLQLSAEGNTLQEIADRLSISPRTAEVHRGNIMRKLSLKTQTDLIRYAIQRGLLAVEA
jgi:two-component system, NarL family, response regulator NreC